MLSIISNKLTTYAKKKKRQITNNLLVFRLPVLVAVTAYPQAWVS